LAILRLDVQEIQVKKWEVILGRSMVVTAVSFHCRWFVMRYREFLAAASAGARQAVGDGFDNRLHGASVSVKRDSEDGISRV
jgi:hypothetical protein